MCSTRDLQSPRTATATDDRRRYSQSGHWVATGLPFFPPSPAWGTAVLLRLKDDFHIAGVTGFGNTSQRASSASLAQFPPDRHVLTKTCFNHRVPGWVRWIPKTGEFAKIRQKVR